MEHYIDFVKQVISTVLTMIFLPVSFLTAPASGYETKKPEEVRTSFTVLSDIHIEGNNYATFEKFTEILNEVHSAEQNNTLVFLGDNTMNGQGIESSFFFGALRFARPAKNLVIAAGNHDYGNGNGDYEKYAKRFRRNANSVGCDIDENYYYKIIDGYYFIVLTSESDSVDGIDISDTQLEWLSGVLAQAGKEDKPIFIFSHHPVNYIENGSYDRLSSVIDDYENVIFFSGHTHWPISSHSFSIVNGVKSVNLPKATEHYDEYGAGIGAVVEVYEDEVLVRFRDFDDSAWIEGYEYSFEF